ncbi:TonB-dependent receptor [Parvularcula bermudensis]
MLSCAAFAILATPMAAAAQTMPEATAAGATQEDKVIVTGRRVSGVFDAIGADQASVTVGVTREELLSAPAGISGLKMLETLPGFNVQTDGALGLYEFGNSVSVRAFRLPQIGFVLDGVPMGRSDAFGGSPIFRYVDNENLGSVIASPGAGDVSLPSYSSLGPIVSYNTTDPAEEFGGVLQYTIGDFDLERSFIKLETGRIGGFTGYISRSKTDSNLWRGPGSIDREHIEAKAKYEFDDDTYLRAIYVANDFFDYDSPSGTEATFDANYGYAYLATVPNDCIEPDPGVFDYNGDGTIDGDDFTPVFTQGSCTQYFEDRINVRQDALYGVTFATDITPSVDLVLTSYFEDKDGFGVSPDSYSNSRGIYVDQAAAGLPVTHPRGVQYGLSEVGGERLGILGGVSVEAGNHLIELGGWYEDEFYNRTQLRLNNSGGSADGEVLFDEVAYFRRNYQSVRQTTQFYVKDTISLLQDQLTLEVGVKSLNIEYTLDGYRDYADYEIDGMPGYGPQYVEAEYEDNFLPMVGAVYRLTPTEQLFASYAQNYALPQGADSVFSTAVSFDAPPPAAEESENFEIGIRTNRPQFYGTAALYYTTFDNRLVQGNVLNPATNEPEAFYINAGETEAYGFELAGVYQPALFEDLLYFNANLTLNRATTKDGFSGNEAGSLLADSPQILFTGGMTYEPTDWAVANLSLKYTGERYADYNEQFEIDPFTVVSGYLDLGGPNSFGVPENVSLRFNVDNLLDEEALSFVFAGSPFYRPLNPRTFQATLRVEY